ncbi:MAG: ribosomal-processing cysteine protease Prp [Lachnospiraceae bacterium]|nr:ribosomal-processing cysteine protease Prp [Lachnospiraceae bacterium]
MTTVTFEKDGHGSYKGFTCFGHAGFAKKRFGKTEPDILCAAISALTANVINGLSEIAGEKLTVTENEETGFIRCIFESELKESSVLLVDSYVLSLSEYAKQYSKNLTVNFKEV